MSRLFIETFPELEPEYHEREKKWNEPKKPFEDLQLKEERKKFDDQIRRAGLDPNSPYEMWLHVVYGDHLNPYVERLIRIPGNGKTLQKIFDFLEQLVEAAKTDEGIEGVLYATIFDRILGNKELESVYTFIRPKTAIFCKWVLDKGKFIEDVNIQFNNLFPNLKDVDKESWRN